MPRKRQALEIKELPGTKYQDLAAAQREALAATASDLAKTIRALLDSGVLIYQNGRIVPNPQG